MAKYTVFAKVAGTSFVEVEANSEEEAIKAAEAAPWQGPIGYPNGDHRAGEWGFEADQCELDFGDEALEIELLEDE
jgi:hypothetical protein